MKRITGINWDGAAMCLVYKASGTPVAQGTPLATSNGEIVTVLGGRPPHKPSSTGQVWVRHHDSDWERTFYPSVLDLVWHLDPAE